MLASRLAAFLLCSAEGGPDAGGLFDTPAPAAEGPADACGSCVDCTLFTAGNHPDFHLIHRTLNRLHPDKRVRDRKAVELSIDVIRHFLLQPIGLRPSRGRAKVFVVVDAERLSDEAQNALLKTLEEPPPDSYLVLLTTAPDQLLATTRSRCQQVPFGPLPDEFIHAMLAARPEMPPAEATFLTQIAQGSAGLALRYAEAGLYRQVDTVIEALRGAADDPIAASRSLYELAGDLAGNAEVADGEEGDVNAARESQALVFALAATLLRDVQRAAVGAAPVALPGRSDLTALAGRTSPRALARAVSAVAAAELQIAQNAKPDLVFDALAIAIGRAFESAPAVT
jgi:DNA polymerase-3 subunit delta'